MDVFLKKIIETTWGKSLLYTILGGLSLSVCWLAFENKRLNEARSSDQKDFRREVIETERRCAKDIEALNTRHLEFLNAALQRMQKIEDKQKRRK